MRNKVTTNNYNDKNTVCGVEGEAARLFLFDRVANSYQHPSPTHFLDTKYKECLALLAGVSFATDFELRTSNMEVHLWSIYAALPITKDHVAFLLVN